MTGAPELGVVGRAGSTSAFDLQRWQPSTAAAPWIEHLWSVQWDLRDGHPVDNAVITFPAMHVTREWGTDSPRHGFPLPSTLIQGVVEEVFTTTISERGTVVGARFRPGGFAARFGRDAAAYTGRTVPVDDELFGGTVTFGEERAEVVAQLDAAIGAGAPAVDPSYDQLLRLLDRIRDDARLHKVADVMALAPWSARTTQRIFRRYVGVPVKWVLCRYRLQHAAFALESDPTADHAELATSLGWYDQAHFINDFRAMLGCTPGEYAARHAVR